MKQIQCLEINSLEQLKAISDPFRVKVLSLLIEKPHTGQEIARILEIPRSKVHYALNELEKHRLIRVERREEKNGILQKFYVAVARGFIPSHELLPYTSELDSYYRQMLLNSLNRSKIRVLSAPEEAFQFQSEDRDERPFIQMQMEVRVNEQTFIEWLKKYRQLLKELNDLPEDGGKTYYLTTIGFQIDESLFSNDGDDEETAEAHGENNIMGE